MNDYQFNFFGIILPFEYGGAEDRDPWIMLRIIPELNQPFNTKERAPFKFVCEVVKASEIRSCVKKLAV